MAKYFNNNRIRWFISAFVCIVCGIAPFLPTVKIVAVDNIFGSSEQITKSIVWFMSESGYPEIYTYTLVGYFLLILPIIVFGFFRELKSWPILFTAVISIIYLLVNSFWVGMVFYSTVSYATSVTLTVWGWSYILLQLVGIINLFSFLPKLKK